MQPVRGPDRASTGGKRRTDVLLRAAVAALAAAVLAAAAAARAQAAGGRGVGMVAVAVAPPLSRNSGVTLWDEIAPPAPLPIPIDAAQQAAQCNVASYTRK